MKYVIITGASKGLGSALAEVLMEQGETVHLLCVARTANQALADQAAKLGISMNVIQADLAEVEMLESLMVQLFEMVDFSKATGLYLVNNAGMVEPVAPLSKYNAGEILTNLHVNLAAPMALTAAFLRLSRELAAPKRVVTVTSGASKRAIYGWSAYCAAKAGVNLFTGCAAEEEKDEKNGAQLAAFSPGVMDTDMQVTIRSSKEVDFKPLADFVKFKTDGVLRPAKVVAEALVSLIFADNFPNGEFVDVKDLLENQ
ncbi:(S)-benzoin forming benzil reductase [Anoxynatronum sibiricum]|uniref:(S)-benzoin forming benzil reductase n=1 Tax=Anoxynatronum sibiricum TaxID=210623 RepID=A0ABU9VS46_9CLOT